MAESNNAFSHKSRIIKGKCSAVRRLGVDGKALFTILNPLSCECERKTYTISLTLSIPFSPFLRILIESTNYSGYEVTGKNVQSLVMGC